MSGPPALAENQPSESPHDSAPNRRAGPPSESSRDETGKLNAFPEYAPRFWHGMRLGTWWQLLWNNRFRIRSFRIPTAFSIAFAGFFNTLLHAVERTLYRKRIEQTRLTAAPIFILGHWRSGTTMLHEMLECDGRFTSPTTHECFASNSPTITDWIVYNLIPTSRQRPMDNMPVGWDKPQEDEFALCNLGLPSPYLRIIFPRHGPVHMDYFDLEDVPEADLRRWQAALDRFLRIVSMRRPKRLIVKSPPHTGRIRRLLELYPDAKFIHMVRDPRRMIPSTVRLWRALETYHGMHIGGGAEREDYVFDCFRRMYDSFERRRDLVPPGNLVDLRYEDLVADPLVEMQRVYQTLGLGEFATIEPAVQQYLDSRKGYQVNRHELPERLEARIRDVCGRYMQRYAYA